MCFSVNIFGDVKWYTLKAFSKLCGRIEMANGIIGPLLLLLFLNRVSSHHYLYHCQNMEPRYPASKSRELVSEDRIILCAYLETTIGQASGFCLLANDNSQKIHVIMPVWSEAKKTPFGAHLWMNFSTVDRSCVWVVSSSTVLLNVTFLKMGFTFVQWENENNMSVVNEKQFVGTVELKGRTTVDISTGTNKGRVAIYKATILKVCGE